MAPVFLPGQSPGQRNLVGYSPQGHKQLDTTEAPQNARTRKREDSFFAGLFLKSLTDSVFLDFGE